MLDLPFPVTEGLYKKPTVVNNVETLAAATGILINGADKFSAIGNKKSAGTKLVCLIVFLIILVFMKLKWELQ